MRFYGAAEAGVQGQLEVVGWMGPLSSVLFFTHKVVEKIQILRLHRANYYTGCNLQYQ